MNIIKRSIAIRGRKTNAPPKFHVYRVAVEPEENHYYAEIPALPGCYSHGTTYEEALKNIKEAAELWLETLYEDGEPIPEENPQILRKAPVTLGLVV